MNHGRYCAHGRQVGKCDTCDLIEAENEISQLKAQVELIRDAISAVRDSSYTKGFGYPDASQVKAQREAWQQLNEALEATPAQCLQEIKAQAVEDALSAIEHYALVPDTTLVCADALRKYANKIRQQAAKG